MMLHNWFTAGQAKRRFAATQPFHDEQQRFYPETLTDTLLNNVLTEKVLAYDRSKLQQRDGFASSQPKTSEDGQL